MKTFDLSKFAQGASNIKGLKNLKVGFNEQNDFINCGNYVMNFLGSSRFGHGGSGSFNMAYGSAGGFPTGSLSVIAGVSGSGKSYVGAKAAKDTLSRGGIVLAVDSEGSMSHQWMSAAGGFDANDPNFLRVSLNVIEDIATLVLSFIDEYEEENSKTAFEDKPLVLILIDSLGMCNSRVEAAQAEDNKFQGAFGSKAKAITAVLRTIINRIEGTRIALVGTQHCYEDSNAYAAPGMPKPLKISGGSGLEFASGQMYTLSKRQAREDDSGEKITGKGADVNGIKSTLKMTKTRFGKAFTKANLHIAYKTGLSPYSGLLELAKDEGKIKTGGAWMTYVSRINGEETKFQRKSPFITDVLDKIMDEWFFDMDGNPIDIRGNLIGGVVESTDIDGNALDEYED